MPKKESKGWISVQDELPEKLGHYIVLWDDGEVGQGLFFPGSESGNIKPRWACESESEKQLLDGTHPLFIDRDKVKEGDK